MAGSGAPFYERHRWQAVTAVVVLVAAIWAFLGIPTPWALVKGLVTEKLPASNTMLVLDASKSMARPFKGGMTKLDAVLRTVDSFTLPLKNEGLALRTFGGSCNDPPGDPLVDFGASHRDEVRDATAGLRPRGRSNLVNAVRAAIDDFADDRFPQDAARRIVVFMGSVDECPGADARDIRDGLAHAGIEARFKFVALKLGRKGRQRLLRFKKALGGRAELAFATPGRSLAAVGDWLERDASATAECDDKVDNDGDRRIDGADPECEAGDTEAPKRLTGECADDVDNDGDGSVDRDDPECASGTTEAGNRPAGECNDGADNDDDGHVDDDDPQCATGTTEAGEPTGDCNDGADNDDDGQIDDDDPQCATGTTEAGEPTGDCNDGADNDDDGHVDDDDPQCATGTTEAGEPTGDCNDGIDNDGDTRVDGADPQCRSGTTEAPSP